MLRVGWLTKQASACLTEVFQVGDGHQISEIPKIHGSYGRLLARQKL
jgi:hypothetical protein